MTKPPTLIDAERIRKAHSLRRVEPIRERLAIALATIPQLRYIKLFPERLTASNVLSADGKKNLLVQVAAEGLVGVELLIDSESQVVQFYAVTSAVQGCGRRIVSAVVSATPEYWRLAVPLAWSGSFWTRMAQDYPRLVIVSASTPWYENNALPISRFNRRFDLPRMIPRMLRACATRPPRPRSGCAWLRHGANHQRLCPPARAW